MAATEPTLSERVAALERTLADVTRERDELQTFVDAWRSVTDALDDVCGKHRWMSEDGDATPAEEAAATIRQLGRRLESASTELLAGSHRLTSALEAKEAAERRATEAARGMAEDIARAWRSEFHAEARVLGEVGHDFIQSFAAGLAPAVPPEREGAGQVVTEADFTRMMGHAPSQDDLERANCKDAGKFGHTACGICPDHKVPRMRCLCVHNHSRPTPPQAAPEPEPLVLRCGGSEQQGYIVVLNSEDCRRIVALASRPTQTAEG